MMDGIKLEPDSDRDYDSICVDFNFAQRLFSHDNKYHNSIHIDSDSSFSVFCDKTLLTNIHQSDHDLTVLTNGCTQVATQRGTIVTFLRSGPIPILC